MNERKDNLSTTLVKNKREFLLDIISGKIQIKPEQILSVDVCGVDINHLDYWSLDGIMDQIDDNKYVWLIKEHVR